MGSTTADVLEYMVWLIWKCLSLTPTALKNSLFAMIFATEDVLEQLLSDSLLAFPPGLFHVFQATAPPSISYLAYRQMPKGVGVCTLLCSRNRAVGLKFTSGWVQIGVVV